MKKTGTDMNPGFPKGSGNGLLSGEVQPAAFNLIPGKIAGMTLQELRHDYKKRLFRQYLPFWEKGGFDKKSGGFMCELFDDGSVENDEKYIWYQGRGIWVYSYLYNHLSGDKKHLDAATISRNFLVDKMYLGFGKWRDSVDRKGNPVKSNVAQGSEKDIYGALFSAAGLIELFRASGRKEDLEIALSSVLWSVETYESPEYEGITVAGTSGKGLRTQGHSFMLVWILTTLLSFYRDRDLEELQSKHVDHIMNHFWNPELGIMNEFLFHDYSRIPGQETYMYTGHSIEALWMVMHEAIRTGDSGLFNTAKYRIRRLIEMDWDYVFGGLGTGDYHVFSTSSQCQGSSFDLKTMWAHTEMLISAMSILEYTGEAWAKEWYERGREYCIGTMGNTGNGVWRQAVDRLGQDSKRPGISIFRKDNFHQVRYMMMNLLAIERMLKNNRKIKQF
jgi:N-acylglucosamine 2-epimerase